MSPLLEFLLWFKREPEAGHRDIGFVTVLLEEHPLQRLGAAPTVGGQQERIFAQVPEDRVRLGERASIVEFEHRNAAIRVLGKKIGLARGSVMKPVILECELHTELTRGESDLVAIAGHLHLMKHGHHDQCPVALIGVAAERSFRRRQRPRRTPRLTTRLSQKARPYASGFYETAPWHSPSAVYSCLVSRQECASRRFA